MVLSRAMKLAKARSAYPTAQDANQELSLPITSVLLPAETVTSTPAKNVMAPPLSSLNSAHLQIVNSQHLGSSSARETLFVSPPTAETPNSSQLC